jgi:hypothetical protein
MMPVPITLKTDMAMLNERMARYAISLKLEPRDVVKMQAGILSRELASGSAPKSKQALERSIERDLRKVYSPAPKRMLPIAHRRGKGFTWIMATPDVITGVKNYDYHMEDSVEDVMRLFHKTKPRGNKYETLGPRQQSAGARIMRMARGRKGRQYAQRLNRIVIPRGVFSQSLRGFQKRAGILGGSWVVSWNVLQPKGSKPPAYKFRHVQDGTARGTYIDGLGIPGHATFSLVNRATGCTQESQLEMVRGKLKHRAISMQSDLQNLLRGAYKRAGFKNS